MVCSHNFHCWCRERVEKISWIWRRQLSSEAGQCEMKWSFSKLQIREEGMNNHGFRVFCCNTGAMLLQAQARAEQCESWILSQKKRRRHESWQVRIFIWFSKVLQHTSRLGNVRWNGAFFQITNERRRHESWQFQGDLLQCRHKVTSTKEFTRHLLECCYSQNWDMTIGYQSFNNAKELIQLTPFSHFLHWSTGFTLQLYSHTINPECNILHP